jgi:hypothetical protein
MRKLIAGMKISADGKMEGPEGTADWVEAWSEDYGLMLQVDACVLGEVCTPAMSGIGLRSRMSRTSPSGSQAARRHRLRSNGPASPRGHRTMCYRAL